MYIKLDENMDLVITVNDSIYQGDNLSQKITFLIPLFVGEIDVATASLYLTYIRADGTPDIVIMERLEETYNESYYQYVVPITCKLTKYAGEVCLWIQVYSGAADTPTIAKSAECILRILASKDISDYCCDNPLTALYQIQQSLQSGIANIDEDIARITEDLSNKADGLSYDDTSKALQLTSGGIVVGNAVVVP